MTVEFIGFIISALALLFLFFRGRAIERYRKEHPELFQEEELEENDPINDVLKLMKKSEERHSSPPSPPLQKPLQKSEESHKWIDKKYKDESLSTIENRHLQSTIEKRRLKSEIQARKLKLSIDEGRVTTRVRNEDLYKKEMSDKNVGEPRISLVIDQLPSLKNMVIYQTILGKPKGLE